MHCNALIKRTSCLLIQSRHVRFILEAFFYRGGVLRNDANDKFSEVFRAFREKLSVLRITFLDTGVTVGYDLSRRLFLIKMHEHRYRLMRFELEDSRRPAIFQRKARFFQIFRIWIFCRSSSFKTNAYHRTETYTKLLLCKCFGIFPLPTIPISIQKF